MSGHIRQSRFTNEAEYRAWHEAEMRKRFMQSDVPGIPYTPIEHEARFEYFKNEVMKNVEVAQYSQSELILAPEIFYKKVENGI